MMREILITVKLPVEHKMFCGCKADGEESCPVCQNHRGAFKILNKEVVEAGIALTLAVGASLNQYTLFDRAIGFDRAVQFSHPIGGAGKLVVSEGMEVDVKGLRLLEGRKGTAEAEILIEKPEGCSMKAFRGKIESIFEELSIKDWEIDDNRIRLSYEERRDVLAAVPDPLLPPVIISQWWTNQIAAKYPELIHIEEPESDEDDIF